MSLPDLQYVVPFFQPIVAVDDMDVFAYEVLAREVRSGAVRSLGPVFEDPAVPDRDKLSLDRHVRRLALERFASTRPRAKLFLNVKPSWISHRRSEETILHELSSLDIDPGGVVIEVTEEELLSDNDEFGRLLVSYRREGCLLAIDDFGKGASSVERIAYVNPDIVKIDSSIVQKVDSHRSFFEICRAMSAFGDISGFDLLFEGVETAYQLERCVTAKGRFFQGYVFSKARPEMDAEFENRDLLGNILSVRTHLDLVGIRRRHELTQEMDGDVEAFKDLIPDGDEVAAPRALLEFAGKLPYYCIRCFVCDIHGRQRSNTCQAGLRGQMLVRDADVGSSWFFRGFFGEGLRALRAGRRSFLSDVYKNVTTKEHVATYMHLLPGERVLCIDVMSTAIA
ncbi:MAG: EAL domain-containing protein [Acidobacteriota bacterium]|jgi:EAL domain-containing protein (putative c-di-GMP-specific phosphodiesterase class I)|nr:EAL domain-containing protein [Acidobacteriota bacterium]